LAETISYFFTQADMIKYTLGLTDIKDYKPA